MEIPIFLWLVIVPLLASPVIYLSGSIEARLKLNIPQILAFIVMAITWVPFIIVAIQPYQIEQQTFTLGVITLCMDGISLLLTSIALLLTTFVIIFSGGYLANENGQEKYYAMLMSMTAMIIGLGCACDIFNLWVWFEAMAICSYFLVAFYNQSPTSLEAGVKYLVQSATGSTLVLLGIGLVLSQTGTLKLSEIREVHIASGNLALLILAGVLFIIGFGVKTALVPMHTWLPDAHSQAPSGISAMLSGVVIEAGLIAMLRSVSALAEITHLWGALLLGFGALNMLFGNLMALRQKQVKRLLAYSSLTHVGYMLFGLGIATQFGEINGALGGLFHLFNHGMMKGLAFLSAGALLYSLHISSGDHNPLSITDLSGAASRYPAVALSFSLALLGLGGIPPLAGFMSKWQILVAGLQTHNILMGLLVIFAALNSVLSLAYYAPLINTLYRCQPSEIVIKGSKLPRMMNIPLFLLSAIILLVGIWPGLIDWLTYPAGSVLLAAFGK